MRTLLFLAWSALAVTANAASPAPVATKAPAAAATPAQIKTQLQTYFFDAAREGRQDMLGEFIRSHYDLNTRDEKGYTALILAAYHGQTPAVEQLLQAGADPCAQDKRGNTALMGAIFKGEPLHRQTADAGRLRPGPAQQCRPDRSDVRRAVPAHRCAQGSRR